MKQIYLFLSFFISVSIFAQTNNKSFENWTTQQNQIYVSGTANFQGITADYEIDDPQFTYNEIVDWSSLNQLTGTESISYPGTGNTNVELVTESTMAIDGAKAVSIESALIKISATVTVFGVQLDTSVTNVAPGILISGVFDLDENLFAEQLLNSTNLNSLNPFTYDGTGQAIDFRPKHLKGSYQYAGVSGDSALVVSGLIKDREVVAYSITRLPNAGSYTAFEIPYTYLSCEMPDTVITLFCSSNLDASFTNGVFSVNSAYTGQHGSQLWVDGLSLDTLSTNEFQPLAVNDTVYVNEEQTDTFNVMLNDAFCDDQVNVITIINAPLNGTSVYISNTEIEYTPNVGFSGADNFTYELCNGNGLCDTATVYINVANIDPCLAFDDFRSVTAGGSSVFNPLDNDIDCGGIPDIIVLPVNGVASVQANGFIAYSPLVGFSGQDSLTYRICSPLNPNQCATAKVYYDVVTSIKNQVELTFSVFPNPATEEITISLAQKKAMQMTIYTVLGKKVYAQDIHSSAVINLADFNEGVYLIQLNDGVHTATKTFYVRK